MNDDRWNAEGWLIGSVIRTARKEWRCEGDGAGPRSRLYACTGADGTPATIRPGDQYLEYLGEAHAFEHGSSHCMACARAFYRRPEDRVAWAIASTVGDDDDRQISLEARGPVYTSPTPPEDRERILKAYDELWGALRQQIESIVR